MPNRLKLIRQRLRQTNSSTGCEDGCQIINKDTTPLAQSFYVGVRPHTCHTKDYASFVSRSRDGCRGKRRCPYLRLPRTHVCRYFLCGYPCTYTVKFITRTKKQKCRQATKEPPSYKSDDFVVFQFHVWV